MYHWLRANFQDNHWSWGEHEANDESETEEESDYSDASGISDDCESGEDEEEESEKETKNQNAEDSEDNEDNLFQEDLRLVFELQDLNICLFFDNLFRRVIFAIFDPWKNAPDE